jgi:hypothetical protein
LVSLTQEDICTVKVSLHVEKNCNSGGTLYAQSQQDNP